MDRRASARAHLHISQVRGLLAGPIPPLPQQRSRASAIDESHRSRSPTGFRISAIKATAHATSLKAHQPQSTSAPIQIKDYECPSNPAGWSLASFCCPSPRFRVYRADRVRDNESREQLDVPRRTRIAHREVECQRLLLDLSCPVANRRHWGNPSVARCADRAVVENQLQTVCPT
jgi:hypothetical protein